MRSIRFVLFSFLATSLTLISGCANINLGPNYGAPFIEQVVQQNSDPKAVQAAPETHKVLIVDITGTISDAQTRGVFDSSPSLLDRVLMQLKKAEKDPAIKTVLLKINSPGGGVTSSDILYHELLAFKQRSGKKLYVQMMDVAASGGYYISMAADHIQAHPTTVTGSVGVVSVTPELAGLMEKVGVSVNVYKTGSRKDSGSPYRQATDEDKMIFRNLVGSMADRFYQIVQSNRNLDATTMKQVKTAQIYTGTAALKSGLVDSLGYLSDGVQKACELGAAKQCLVVTYRYGLNANATVYSPSMSLEQKLDMSLIDVPLIQKGLQLESGIYYMYMP